MNTKPHENNAISPINGHSKRLSGIASSALFWWFVPSVGFANESAADYALPSTDDLLFTVGGIVVAVVVFATLYLISKRVHGDGKPSNEHTISHLINNDIPLNVFDFDFMYLHYDIGKLYEAIKTKYRHIKSSSATPANKAKAEVFMLVAGKALDKLRATSEVTLDSTYTDSEITSAKLNEAKIGLLKIINDDSNRLGYSATDIVLPDSYDLQERLDNLRIIATDILYEDAADGKHTMTETATRPANRYNAALTNFHKDYLDVKDSNVDNDIDTVFIDVALAAIFDDISEFLFRMDAGEADTNNSLIVTEILGNENFFKQQYATATKRGGLNEDR